MYEVGTVLICLDDNISRYYKFTVGREYVVVFKNEFCNLIQDDWGNRVSFGDKENKFIDPTNDRFCKINKIKKRMGIDNFLLSL